MSGSSCDIVITGGLIITSRAVVPGNIVIADEKVVAIAPVAEMPSARRTISAQGKIIFPGIVDAHLHPVYSDRIATLSRAAAAGGVTTLIPYIGAFKAWGGAGDLRAALDQFIEEGETTSLLDFAVHLSLNRDDLPHMAAIMDHAAERGVRSYKLFTAYKKRGMQLDDPEILAVMNEVIRVGGLLAAHCENGAIIEYLENRALAEGRTGPEHFAATHPDLSEAEALFRFLCLGRMAGCPLYLPHLSTRQSLDVLDLARSWAGPRIFAETCPHYLDLTDELMTVWGSRAKVTPPLRSPEHADFLWAALADGRLDVVGSDHAGHASAAKEPHFGDVFASPTGIPGGDLLLRVMYDRGVARGRLTLPHLARLLCENPARIFGLWPGKGSLDPGANADLVIWDPAAETHINGPAPVLKTDYTLYQGQTLVGRPDLVMRRGRVIAENGAVDDTQGPARYLPAAFGHWPER